MKKHFIETTQSFITYCNSLPDKTYFKKGEKWNAAAVVDHLHRSISPVNMAMGLPSFVLDILFGRSNRPSRDYDTVVSKYKSALEKGGKASGPYVPKGNLSKRKKNIQKLEKRCQQLAKRIDRRQESDWDNRILPHPLLGKMTLREMMHFTTYHVAHHLETLKTFNRTS